MSWLELSVTIDQEAVESVSELFAQVGYNGGVALDQPFVGSPDGPEYRVDTTKLVTVKTYLPLDGRAEAARTRLAQGLWALGMLRPVGALQVRQIEEEDWANAWKAHYPIQRVGQRCVIVPSWLQYTPQPGDVVLKLDPGMAFGTGLHPTTRLCLALLERYAAADARTLDLGCGSGILAIAAAKLGAQPVLALDNDPIAVQATVENVRRNGLETTITTAEGSLGPGAALGHWLGDDWAVKQRQATQTPGPTAFEPTDEFDLIVANILADVHVLLAPYLQCALKPGGILLTSGIIYDRAADVARALEDAGLHVAERLREGDWIAFAHSKAF